MESAILFRFHDNLNICKNRLKLLKKYNPNKKIYGLGEKITNYKELFDSGLDDLYVITDKSSRWKWLNGDLAIRNWFINRGHKFSFDRLYVVEWDLIYLNNLNTIYEHIPKNGIGITGLQNINKTNKSWFNGRYNEIQYIKKQCSKQYKKDINNIKIGIFPGLVLPRNFIQNYAEIDTILDIGNDEMRISIHGLYSDNPVYDTKLQNKNITIDKYFNTKNIEVKVNNIKNNKYNRNAFHPVRKQVEI